VNHSFQNYPFFIKLAKMHSGGKHQASPKFQQFQNHAQPIVRKCGHVVQPPNPTRNLKSTFPTTPNLPSYSFQRNPAAIQDVYKKCPHVNRNQNVGNRNNVRTGAPMAPNANKMPTTPLLKNIDNWIRTNQMMGHVNNVNNYSFQKVPLTEIYKKAAPVNRGVENSNQKVANVMQNANSLPIQKMNVQQKTAQPVNKNTVQQPNNNRPQLQKCNTAGANIVSQQVNKNKDAKSMPPEGAKSNVESAQPPPPKNDTITEIYKRSDNIQQDTETQSEPFPVTSSETNVNFQKVTQELANIIKDFQKQIQSVPISKPKMEEVPSAMIQPKNKEFFKSDKSQGSAPKNQTNSNNAANKNQTNNNAANKNQTSNNNAANKNQTNNSNAANKNQTNNSASKQVPKKDSQVFNKQVGKQTSLKNFSKTSISPKQSATSTPRRFCSSTHHALSARSSASSRGFTKRSSSLNVDPLKLLKDEVHRAIRERKTFTVRGLFAPIRKALVARGWVEKFHISYKDRLNDDLKRYQSYSINELLPLMRREDLTATCKNLIKSKLLGGYQVDFYWGSNDEAFKENPDKIKFTIINKLKREIFSYTNKLGLCDASKFSYWYQKSNVSKLNHPRSYSLGKNGDLKGFIEDFNITAAMSLLKWVVKINVTRECKLLSPSGKIPLETFDFALNECCKFIKKARHEDIDMQIADATEHEWNQFLDYFYKLVHYNNHFKSEGAETEDSLVRKCNYVLNNLRSFYPFVDMDGMMNIWILKPTASSRGRGIHMCRTLQYVLKVTKQNTHIRYIIQKYIERPLLIYNTKFDIRQWFLISNCCPLTIWMYKECYLRFSSQTYNLRKLHESIHLTNNSVQCKYKNTSLDSALPSYNMWDSNDFVRYLTNIGYPNTFKDTVYPGMKQCITAAVLMHQDKMVVRKNCFELYGADFILTEDFQPWLLEINSNPALYGSTPVTARMCPKVLEDVIKGGFHQHCSLIADHKV
jgi:tubulin monoglycylase TTLL3/8